MILNEYDAISLSHYAKEVKPTESFLLDLFFSKREPHENPTIWVKTKKNAKTLASFANKNATEPSPVKANGEYSTNQYTLPRIYESKIFTQNELKRFNEIDKLFAEGAERDKARAEMIANEIDDLKNRVINRLEQMASKALTTGKFISNDANSDSDILFDFDFKSDKQFHALTKKWSAVDSDPIKDLRLLSNKMLDNSGYRPTSLVLGRGASDAFLSNANVLKYLDAQNFRLGAVDISKQVNNTAVEVANVLGIKIYEYSSKYIDSDGVAQDFFSENGCLLLNASINAGAVHTAQILRVDEKRKLYPIAQEMALIPITNELQTALTWTLDNISAPIISDVTPIISVTNVI